MKSLTEQTSDAIQDAPLPSERRDVAATAGEPCLLNLLLEHEESKPNSHANNLMRGVVHRLADTGEIHVIPNDSPEEIIPCEVLQTCESLAIQFAPGDRVLMWPATRPGQLGVVLGRIGLAENTGSGDPNGEVVIESEKRLTIRCGDAAITLNEDGKLLISGVDVVSRAKAANRIKGATVRIN